MDNLLLSALSTKQRYNSLKHTGPFSEIFTRTTNVHLLPSHSSIGAALQYS